MDLDLIKEAAKKVEDAQLIYRALSEVGEALAVAGNLEGSRLSLEPRVAVLRADVAALEQQKDELVAELTVAREEIVAARATNETTVATELASARLDVVDEVRRYRDELMKGSEDLADKKAVLQSEVNVLSEKKAGLQSELAALDTKIDNAESVLQETNDRIATLKKQMSDIVGKI